MPTPQQRNGRANEVRPRGLRACGCALGLVASLLATGCERSPVPLAPGGPTAESAQPSAPANATPELPLPIPVAANRPIAAACSTRSDTGQRRAPAIASKPRRAPISKASAAPAEVLCAIGSASDLAATAQGGLVRTRAISPQSPAMASGNIRSRPIRDHRTLGAHCASGDLRSGISTPDWRSM